MLATPPPLNGFLGKTMSQICPFSIGKNKAQNHCAHFVSHVMQYDVAETCKNFTLADKQAPGVGATLRVDRIFNASTSVGAWNSRPPTFRTGLIFVTISGNVRRSGPRYMLGDNPKKHIGIFVNGVVWHYGNSQDKVFADPEILFINKFTHAYRTAGQSVEFFYGAFL